MKKSLALLMVPAALTLLAACGDTVENNTVNQTGMDVVSFEDDLPKCTDDNEGDIVYVKEDKSTRLCVDGEWNVTNSEGSDTDFSCKTEELKDKSGLKIVCNGDSIGVVLNGAKGEDGEKGEAGKDGKDGKDGADGEDGKDAEVVKPDTTVNDSEKVSVSLDSLVGVTQKGPFLKGSTVYLYELSDGRTLKQTNGNFTSNITSDDGRYKFTARDLVSQYAMVVVDGYYRNEVTGVTSDAPIRLKAITDMRKRSSVNVNLLTQLEFDRVYHLVTREKKTVKNAKQQAQEEILKLFNIELESGTDAEDMDVFGKTDADAALLAVSILLQGDGNATDLSVLLTEISNALVEKGVWNDSVAKFKLADWALKADCDNRLVQFRKNVGGWHLNGDTTVPEFEKFVRNFVSEVDGLGVCGGKKVLENTAVNIAVPNSDYYSETYAGTKPKDSKVRFICKAGSSGELRWHIATDLEKDTLGWAREAQEGSIKKGQINKNMVYVFENGGWRHGTDLDDSVNIGCTYGRKDTMALAPNNTWYRCVGDTAMNLEEYKWNSAWRKASNLEMDTLGWGHAAQEGDVRNGQINTNLTYVYENENWRHGTVLDGVVGLGCIQNRRDTLVRVSSVDWYKCVGDTVMKLDESNWSSAWRKVSDSELDYIYWNANKNTDGTLLKSPYTGRTMVWDNDALREPTDTEIAMNRACVREMYGLQYVLQNGLTYSCSEIGWPKTGSFMDMRDSNIYSAVQMNNQIWMAENLRYVYKLTIDGMDSVVGNYALDDTSGARAKYGRYYNWSAAVDSTALVRDGSMVCDAEYVYKCELPNRIIQGACPDGWHLPTRGEWEELIEYAGGENVAGSRLKSKEGWAGNGGGPDSYYFSALPAGDWSPTEGIEFEGSQAYFMTVSQYMVSSTGWWGSYVVNILNFTGKLQILGLIPTLAFSVRCVKD